MNNGTREEYVEPVEASTTGYMQNLWVFLNDTLCADVAGHSMSRHGLPPMGDLDKSCSAMTPFSIKSLICSI